MKGSSSATARSESEKEKTKMRERQRRAITGKIFHGLRKHGGYRLSPRADINEVLRHLATEAGWTVHSDGTTFRSSSVGNCCPVCGAVRQGGVTPTPTPTSSAVIHGGGECSTTASPRHVSGGNVSSALDLVVECDIPMSFYSAYGGNIRQQQYETYSGGFTAGGAMPVMFQQQQLQEARVSNHSTSAGSS